MKTTLEEALQSVELEAGRTYRCQVRDQWVEVRVVDKPAVVAEPGNDSDLASEAMLDPWVELPEPKWTGKTISRLAKPEPPDIPEIPTEDLE